MKMFIVKKKLNIHWSKCSLITMNNTNMSNRQGLNCDLWTLTVGKCFGTGLTCHTCTQTPAHTHTRAHTHPRARTHRLAHTHKSYLKVLYTDTSMCQRRQEYQSTKCDHVCLLLYNELVPFQLITLSVSVMILHTFNAEQQSSSQPSPSPLTLNLSLKIVHVYLALILTKKWTYLALMAFHIIWPDWTEWKGLLCMIRTPH